MKATWDLFYILIQPPCPRDPKLHIQKKKKTYFKKRFCSVDRSSREKARTSLSSVRTSWSWSQWDNKVFGLNEVFHHSRFGRPIERGGRVKQSWLPWKVSHMEAVQWNLRSRRFYREDEDWWRLRKGNDNNPSNWNSEKLKPEQQEKWRVS